MRHNNNVLITTHKIPQGSPSFQTTGRELLDCGFILAVGTLISPRIFYPGVVSDALKLGLHLGHCGASVARISRDLLENRHSNDWLEILCSKSMETCVNGATHRRSEELGKLIVVRELFAQSSALLLSKRSQVRVLHRLILDGEIVEALGVANKVDSGRHYDDDDDVYSKEKMWLSGIFQYEI